MLVSRDVDVYGASDQVANLITRLRAEGAINEWQPTHEYSKQMRPYPKGQEPLVFQYQAAGEKRALLWFFPKSDRATVGNIVPLDGQKIDPATYNAIAASFIDRYLDRLCQETGCRIKLGPAERTARSDLSPEAMRALEAFSDRANKATGKAHPDDARRWADFVIQCFRDGKKISIYVLREWMRNAEWEDSIIDDLYDDFETAFEVLERYEETR